MIPDLYWSEIPLGPIPIYVWGIFVAAGILASMFLGKRVAKQQGIAPEIIVDSTAWIIAAAFIGARLWFVISELQLYIQDPLGVFRVWEGGMSISGALLGGALTALFIARKKQLPLWKYLEIITYVLPLGLAIGRIGCFFIFDHPGSQTDFILGELYYVDGLVRHNHGLYLSLNGGLMFLTFFLAKKRWQPKAPFFTMTFLVWYGLFRLIADFDRIIDARYFGLTAAQIGGMAMIFIGSMLFIYRKDIVKHT